MKKQNNKQDTANLAKRLQALEVKSNKPKTKILAARRSETVIRGKGSYSSSASAMGNSYLSGNNFSLFSGTWNGKGSYRLTGGNSCWDSAGQVPIMHSDGGRIRFAHKEYIGQIASSVAYTNQFSDVINPANPDMFPYLSGISGSFQEYKFRGLAFSFKSTSADALNSTNTALGMVAMAVQYRSDATAPTSKLQLLNEMWSVDAKPSENVSMPVECAPKESPMNLLYVGTGSAASNDPKFYNLGRLVVATQGSQAAADIGELWVSYDIELYKPIMDLGAAGPLGGTTAHYTGTTQTTANAFANATKSYDDVGITFGTNNFTIACVAGQRFYFVYTGSATSTTASLGLTASVGSITLTGSSNAGNATALWEYDGNINVVTTVTGVITVSFTNVVNTGSTWYLVVTQIPSPYA